MPKETAAIVGEQSLALVDLLRLATRFHVGGSGSAKDLGRVIHLIRERAAKELDTGDGLKYETVRVERKLDGTVSIFFGF